MNELLYSLLRKGIAFLMYNVVYMQNLAEKGRRFPCRCSTFISYLDFRGKYAVPIFNENGENDNGISQY